jgi:hypothetical protein
MANDDKRVSKVNNRTGDTFWIPKDNIGQVIAAIRADEGLQSIVLDPLTPGARKYEAHLKVGEELLHIVELVLLRDRYLGDFDDKFKSEEYQDTYGQKIIDVYARLRKIFVDNSDPRVRRYLERATPIPGHSPTGGSSTPRTSL